MFDFQNLPLEIQEYISKNVDEMIFNDHKILNRKHYDNLGYHLKTSKYFSKLNYLVKEYKELSLFIYYLQAHFQDLSFNGKIDIVISPKYTHILYSMNEYDNFYNIVSSVSHNFSNHGNYYDYEQFCDPEEIIRTTPIIENYRWINIFVEIPQKNMTISFPIYIQNNKVEENF